MLRHHVFLETAVRLSDSHCNTKFDSLTLLITLKSFSNFKRKVKKKLYRLSVHCTIFIFRDRLYVRSISFLKNVLSIDHSFLFTQFDYLRTFTS